MKEKKNYWGYRINVDEVEFFNSELNSGRLRQGWGWNKKQDLRNMKMDEGAGRNRSIFNKVKKGDILLIPRCPAWEDVTIVEATEDFDKGYYFEISKKLEDYGHIFPARKIKYFARDNINVSGNIRASLKNMSRFWNMSSCGKDIERLIKKAGDLSSQETKEQRFFSVVNGAFYRSFDSKAFSDEMYDGMVKNFSNEEWEFALVEGLKKILPEPIIVERTGGKEEKKHGCDIMIRYPGIFGVEYIIGIQVKDYQSQVSNDPIKQVRKVDTYFAGDENYKVIDKIVVITKSEKIDNSKLENYAEQNGVKIIFAKELNSLLCKMGRAALGLSYE